MIDETLVSDTNIFVFHISAVGRTDINHRSVLTLISQRVIWCQVGIAFRVLVFEHPVSTFETVSSFV